MPTPDPTEPEAVPSPPGGWRAHTPNALTIARLVMTVAVVACLAGASTSDTPRLVAAAILFTLAALTDALDGYLARKWHAVSRFGRVMDPLADKLLVLGTFAMLAAPGLETLGVQAWMVVVILARELLVTSLRGVYETLGVDFSATLSGKLKMIAQSVAAPALLLLPALTDPQPIGSILAWTVTLITAWSALPYLLRAWRARSVMNDKSNFNNHLRPNNPGPGGDS